MDIIEIKDIFIRNGWKEELLSRLPANQLNENLDFLLYYGDKLSFRFHFKEKLIRLMIYNGGDDRCLQFNYKNELPKIIEAIISIQNELTVETYFNYYFSLQLNFDISILAYEQFL